MPIFEYKALTTTGEVKKGIIDGDTARDARNKLRAEHLHVTDMREVVEVQKRTRGGAEVKKFAPPKLEFQRRVSTRELAIFTRQFATLLKSGIQLADALKALIEQATDRRLEQVLRVVKEEITAGNSLAEALAKHPAYFSDLYVNMVRAGEASGTLDVVLGRVADYLQKQASLKSKVVSAITYPCIMVTVAVAVVIFLMSFVVPKITAVLLERGQQLPWVTQVLKTVSEFIRDFWIIIGAGVVAAIFLFKAVLASEAARLRFDTFRLRMPILGPLFSKQAISRFCLTFSTLLRSGLPALEALKIVALVVNNARLTQVINDIHQRIMEGADIATPIKRSKVFPPMIGYMVAVGEQSGQLEEVLERIAENYEEELDHAIQRLTSLLEPVIIIMLAVVVSFIIAAVLLPLLNFRGI